MANIIIDRATILKLHCKHCSSFIEFNVHDWIRGTTTNKDHFICPACENEISYPFYQLSPKWQRLLTEFTLE